MIRLKIICIINWFYSWAIIIIYRRKRHNSKDFNKQTLIITCQIMKLLTYLGKKICSWKVKQVWQIQHVMKILPFLKGFKILWAKNIHFHWQNSIWMILILLLGKKGSAQFICRKDFVWEELNAQNCTTESKRKKSKPQKIVPYYSYFLKSYPNYWLLVGDRGYSNQNDTFYFASLSWSDITSFSFKFNLLILLKTLLPLSAIFD